MPRAAATGVGGAAGDAGRDGGRLSRAGGLVLKERIPAAGRALWTAVVNTMSLADRERKNGGRAGLPLRQRVRLWRTGFLSESATIYGSVEPARLGDYLSDWARFHKTGHLDRPFDAVLDDKLCFWAFMRNFSDRIASALGLVRDGRLIRLDVGTGAAPAPPAPAVAGLARLAAPGSKLVLKPCVDGSGGAGVFVYERRDGAHVVNGVLVTPNDLGRRLGGGVWLVCAYVEQADYARTIFPDVANTIRVLTMYDDEAGQAFAAAAVHRFGTRAQGPTAVDNWSRGGLTAAIDLAGGCLGRAYGFPSAGGLVTHATHPDTGLRSRAPWSPAGRRCATGSWPWPPGCRSCPTSAGTLS